MASPAVMTNTKLRLAAISNMFASLPASSYHKTNLSSSQAGTVESLLRIADVFTSAQVAELSAAIQTVSFEIADRDRLLQILVDRVSTSAVEPTLVRGNRASMQDFTSIRNYFTLDLWKGMAGGLDASLDKVTTVGRDEALNLSWQSLRAYVDSVKVALEKKTRLSEH